MRVLDGNHLEEGSKIKCRDERHTPPLGDFHVAYPNVRNWMFVKCVGSSQNHHFGRPHYRPMNFSILTPVAGYLFLGGGQKCKNHLAEVVRSKPGRPVYVGKRHIPPLLGLFGPMHVSYLKGLDCLFNPL